MTYEEIKSKLTKCEKKLKELQTSSSKPKNYEQSVSKLNVLKESLEKQLKEAEKGIVYTDDEKKAKDLADDGANVKLTKESEFQGKYQFDINETKAIAKKVGKAVAIAVKELSSDVKHMKAVNIKPDSFNIRIIFKNGNDDEFKFFIEDDTLHLADFSYDRELVGVGVKPDGEAIVHIEHLANELIKVLKDKMYEGMSDQEFADAKEKDRLEKHPEKEKIKAIQALIRNANKNEGEYAAGKGQLNVYGYQTRHFDICPGAVSLFKRVLKDKDKDEDDVKDLAIHHDYLFLLEKIALDMDVAKQYNTIKAVLNRTGEEGKAKREHFLKRAIQVASDIYELGKKLGLDQNTDLSYIQNHIEKINDALREDDVNEAPDDRYYIKVRKNDKASQNALQDAMETWHDPFRFTDIEDDRKDNYVTFYFNKKDWNPGMKDDIEGNGVDVIGTNIPDFDDNLNEEQPTVFDDESMDALYQIILKYVKDPKDAEKELDMVDYGGLDAMSPGVIAQLERDPEFEAWYDKLHNGSSADTDYMQRRRAEKDYQQETADGDYDADKAQKDDEEEYERGYDDDGLPLGEDALGFSDIEKFGSKAASDIDISVRRDPNYTFGKRPGDDARLRYKYAKQLGYLEEASNQDIYFVKDRWQNIKDKFTSAAEKQGLDFEVFYFDDRAPFPAIYVGDKHFGPKDKSGNASILPQFEKSLIQNFNSILKSIGVTDLIAKKSTRYPGILLPLKKELNNEGEEQGGDIDVGHQDDEPSMLKSTAYESATYAAKLYKKLAKYDQFDGEVDFPNWWQSKLILAKDYLSKAFHYLDSEEKQPMIDKLALEGKYKSDAQRKAIHAKKAELDEAEFTDKERKELKDMSKSLKGSSKGHGQQAKYLDKLLKERDGNNHPDFTDMASIDKGMLYVDNENMETGEPTKPGSIVAIDGSLYVVTNIEKGDNYLVVKAPNSASNLEEGQAAIKKQLDKINQALKQHKDKTVAIVRKDVKQRTEDEKAHLAQMADLTKKKKDLLDKYGDAVAGINKGQELDA